MAPSGNQTETEKTNFSLQHRKKPVYSTADGRLHNFTTVDGLAGNTVVSMGLDHDGNVSDWPEGMQWNPVDDWYGFAPVRGGEATVSQ